MLRQALFFLTLLGCTMSIPAHGMMSRHIYRQLVGFRRLNPSVVQGTFAHKLTPSPIAVRQSKSAITELEAKKQAFQKEINRVEAQLEALRIAQEVARINEKMHTLNIEEILSLLESDGTTAKIYTPKGQTPLHFAAWFGDHEATVRLLDQGYRANEEDIDHDTPIDLARIAGHVDIVHMLVATLE